MRSNRTAYGDRNCTRTRNRTQTQTRNQTWNGLGVMAAALAMGITGCSGSGQGSHSAAGHTSATGGAGALGAGGIAGATGSPGGQPSPNPAFASWTFATDAATAQAPTEFAHPPRWSVPVTLSHDGLAGFGNPVVPNGAPGTADALMTDQAKVGMIAVVGNEVAVPSFGAPVDPKTSSLPTVSVQLLDAKTGKALATVPIPDAVGYYGMHTVTVGGKSALEVRYEPKPAGADSPQFASVLLDQAGNRLWSSAGQQVAGPGNHENGLAGDQNTGFVAEGGYVERIADPDPLDIRQTKSVVSVLDLFGRTLLTVPTSGGAPAGGTGGSKGATGGSTPSGTNGTTTLNTLQLIGGYAIEATFTTPATPSGVPAPISGHFTVYDLAQGVKKVATVAQPMVLPSSPSGGNWRHVLAACKDRLLMQWPQISQTYATGPSSVQLAVLDLATGRTTTPVTVPSDEVGGNLIPALTAASTPDCSAALVTGANGVSRQAAVAVDWATGRARWQHLGPATIGTVTPQPVFEPLTVQDSVVYGLQITPSAGTQATALSMTDGTAHGGGATLDPVAFTADGAPVFIQYDQGTPPAPSPRPTPSTRVSLPPVSTAAPDLFPMTVWIGATSG